MYTINTTMSNMYRYIYIYSCVKYEQRPEEIHIGKKRVILLY